MHLLKPDPKWQLSPPKYLIGILLFLIFIAYHGVLSCGYVSYDDPAYISQNPMVLGGITKESIQWAFNSLSAGISYWHPLTWLSHMIDSTLFGFPQAAHLTNLWIHTFTVVACFWTLRLMGIELGSAFVVSALFGIHPTRVEVVAWLSERKELLSTFFGFLTFSFYILYVKQRLRAGYVLAVGTFSFAMLSKPTLVTMPGLLVLLDIFILKVTKDNIVIQIIRSALNKWPFVIIAFMVGAAAMAGQKEIGALVSLETLSPAARIGHAIVVFGKYAIQMLMPRHLSPIYIYDHDISATMLIVCLVVLLAGATAVREATGAMKFGYWFFIISALPMIGLIQVSFQDRADRYTYVPFFGLFLISTLFFSQSLSHFPRVRLAVVGGVLITCCTLTMGEVNSWRNSEALYTHCLKANPENYIALNNLSGVYAERGDIKGAMRCARSAWAQNSAFTPALYNLIEYSIISKQFDRAILFSKYAPNLPGGSTVSLAGAFYETGDYRSAVRACIKAKGRCSEGDSRPDVTLARINLGFGKAASSLRILMPIVTERPNDMAACDTIASAYYARKEYASATYFAQKAFLLARVQNKRKMDKARAKWESYRDGVVYTEVIHPLDSFN